MMLVTEKFLNEFISNFEGKAALILSFPNRLYLTAFSSSDGAVLFLGEKKYLIVDFRYYEMAKNQCNDYKVILSEKGILRTVKEICDECSYRNIVVEDNYLTVSQDKRIKELFEGFEIEYFGNFFDNLRSVKSEKEVKLIRESQKLTDSAFNHILDIINKGMTENDVATEIEYYFKRNGAEPAFKTIAVSGRNSSCPHGEPSNVTLTENSFLTMDFGAKLNGYCSDMTRTIVIGKADSEMREVYGIVLEAQKRALDIIKSGVLGSDVDAKARNYIASFGFEKNFGHSTGHGLGIEVHETPSFSMNYNKPISNNSVLSVEPGIYIEGKYGVRIEDIVVVKDDGYENLTTSDKNLIEIN